MSLKINSFLFLMLLSSVLTYGQFNQYEYKRTLKGVSGLWHEVTIPDSVLAKVSSDFSDLRVYGVTENDTLEAPFLLNASEKKNEQSKRAFSLINSSYNAKGYFFTFKLQDGGLINEIHLDLKNQNFDWLVNLEGSQDQTEWFTLLEDYRVLSIHNKQTNFAYTKLKFPNSEYAYYRIRIKSSKKPLLSKATVHMTRTLEAQFKDYPIHSLKVENDEATQKTLLHIDLKQRLPISYLKIEVADSLEYYRPITIQFISDSIETEKGWRYNYATLSSGILNSATENEFTFESAFSKKLLVQIHNYDNLPLEIERIEAKGYQHKLTMRLSKAANYFLVYGNKKARKPRYDIEQAVLNIPANPGRLSLGKEVQILKEKSADKEPLFKNKVWLWMLMGVIILLLGWFSIRMIRAKA